MASSNDDNNFPPSSTTEEDLHTQENQSSNDRESLEPVSTSTTNVEQRDQENNDYSNAEDSIPKRKSVFQDRILHEYEWKPEGEIRAVVHIIHGIHEYMGRYELLAQHLKENGLLVRGLDLVGHGRSEGDRGHIDSIESYVTDVVNHVKDTRKEFNQLPLFIIGHSNGGLIAAGVTLRIQDMLRGVIFSAPALDNEASTALKLAAKIIAFFSPQTGVISLDENTISTIQEEIEAYNNDPLIYRGKPKAGYAIAALNAQDDYRPRLAEISLPILIIHGTGDTLVPIAASNLLFNNATSTDKIFEQFKGSRHEILHDKDQERARQLICQWVLARLSGHIGKKESGLEQKDESMNNVTENTPQPLEEKKAEQ